jgi:hypothetical protein
MTAPSGPSRVHRRQSTKGKAARARAREAYYKRFRLGKSKHNA